MQNDPFLFFRYVFASVFFLMLLVGAYLVKNHGKLFGSDDEVMPSENGSARSYTKVMVYTVWVHAVVLSGAFALFLGVNHSLHAFNTLTNHIAMNRIHQLDPDQATGKAKELFEAARKKFGKVSNGFRVLGNSPAALEGYLALKASLANGVLSPKLQEGLALIVGEINGCGYCLSAHTLSSRGMGLSQEEIIAARRASSNDGKCDAALKFARSIAVQRGQVGDSELQAARRAGLNDAELVEIVLHVATNSMTNFLNNAARTVIDFPEVQPGDFVEIPPGAVAVA